MTTFNLKQVETPLFGAVEMNTDPWLDAFSKGTAISIVLDSAAFDILADELELDAEGLAGDAQRYVTGGYRPKARGMGGGRLGELGEVLAFLVNRAVPGRKILRVVSWRAAGGQTVTGSRFPQPDFIFTDPGAAPAALEVKSTQAFDFIDLRDTPKKWTWLQPCSSVRSCRKEALAQLAYVNGSISPQQHSLLVQNGHVVPFPVGKGVAAAVVAVDGRVDSLRADARFRTPKHCRDAARNCWSCIPRSCHFALVTMPNTPGHLALAGADRESSPEWFRAYRRWSQALAARDLVAVRSTLLPLVESVVGWRNRAEVEEPDLIRAFWGSYLGDAMRTRGFKVEIPGQLGDLRLVGANFDWVPAPQPRNPNRVVDMDAITQFVAGDDEGGHEGGVPFWLSTRLAGDNRGEESLSVGVVGDFFEFRLASHTWWSAEEVERAEVASQIASRLLAVGVQVSRLPIGPPPEGESLPLREIGARVGDQPIPLGWELKPFPTDVRPWSGRWFDSRFWLRRYPRQLLPWPAHLALGDPRIRLRVRRDGRAELRVHKELMRRLD